MIGRDLLLDTHTFLWFVADGCRSVRPLQPRRRQGVGRRVSRHPILLRRCQENMMEWHEISLRSHVSKDDIVTYLAETLNIAPDAIGTPLDFWSRASTPEPLAAGLEIFWSDQGYQTLVRLDVWRDLGPVALLHLAQKMTKSFKTDVAIVDVIAPSKGQSIEEYLVITPEDMVYRAYDACNDDFFEVDIPGAGIPFDEAMRLVPMLQ